jgi:hypothetical protein
MPVAKFVKDNLVLVIGLTLPILLMAVFLALSVLPDLADPPKYDLVFSSQDYPSTPIPISLRLVVKDGVLVAQYTRPAGQQQAFGGGWKKLFIYEASSRRVRQLTFGFPSDMHAIEGTREEPVASAAGLRLDTTLQSPDGYELSFGDGRGGGLMLEIFGGSRRYEPRLRKGGRSVPITAAPGDPFAYGGVEFVGWVTARNMAVP